MTSVQLGPEASSVNVSEEPNMIGTLGAALLALRQLEKICQDTEKEMTTEETRAV